MLLCTQVELDAVVITKCLALVVGLALTMLLSPLLAERLHGNAVEAQLLLPPHDDAEGHDLLEKLLDWRDLINSILGSVLALFFVASDKLNSTCAAAQNTAHLVVFGIAPIMLFTGLLLAKKLQLKHIRSRVSYWTIFSLSVLPWYGLSFLLVFSP